jgi:hypothetical protein
MVQDDELHREKMLSHTLASIYDLIIFCDQVYDGDCNPPSLRVMNMIFAVHPRFGEVADLFHLVT